MLQNSSITDNERTDIIFTCPLCATHITVITIIKRNSLFLESGGRRSETAVGRVRHRVSGENTTRHAVVERQTERERGGDRVYAIFVKDGRVLYPVSDKTTLI